MPHLGYTELERATSAWWSSSSSGVIARSWGTQPISRRLAIAGWIVAVVVGGFGLLYVIGAALGAFLTFVPTDRSPRERSYQPELANATTSPIAA